jgi:division/cell wall cluster transcriptional repressor MraZ
MSKKEVQTVASSTPVHSSVLVGRFDHALDAKKRLTIPSEWRALMGDPSFIYVMPDREKRCVNLIPQAEMDVWLAKIRERALFDSSFGAVLQTIGANSQIAAFDVQGRVRIPDRFLRFADLSGTVAMVGAVKMIKVWNPSALAPVDSVDQSALDAALAAVPF